MAQRFLVLRIEPSGESYLKLHLLGQEEGLLFCMKRTSRKSTSKSPRPDLFDTAEVELENSKQGTLQFVRDYHIIERREAIGRSYRSLERASTFCNLLIRNGAHLPDLSALYQLARRSLDAFEERGTPEIVYFKSLYLLLKDEGFPIRESWWPSLPLPLSAYAKEFVERPCPERLDSEASGASQQIIEHLENWVRRETELILQR